MTSTKTAGRDTVELQMSSVTSVWANGMQSGYNEYSMP